MNFGYIYIIENLISGKLYVGQAVDPERRHKYQFSRFTKCIALRNALRKYGGGNFDFCLLESCKSRKELNFREIYWIKELNTLSPGGYNLTTGGESPIFSKETRAKISRSRIGSKNPMYGLSGNQSPTFGRKHTDSAKQKISEVHKGKEIPAETREKMRVAHEGMHKGSENPFFGKKHSEEAKIKMRRSATLRRRKKEIING